MNTYERSIKNKLILLLGQNSEAADFIKEMEPIGDLLFFGGSVRDLCINPESTTMPRDFDIAINFKNRARFESLIESYNYRKNRFGGYKFFVSDVEFDIWDLNNTWAFRNNYLSPSEENLAKSVFLNIDGIVYNFNKSRLYDDVFRSSINSSTLDITLEENPQIELNLLRALNFKHKYGLEFSSRLKDLFKERIKLQEEKLIDELYNIQLSHYRQRSYSKEDLRKEIEYI